MALELADKDYTVAVAETDIRPGEVHYRRVDIVPVGRFDTWMVAGTSSVYHEEGDRTEEWQMPGSSLHSLKGKGPAFH